MIKFLFSQIKADLEQKPQHRRPHASYKLVVCISQTFIQNAQLAYVHIWMCWRVHVVFNDTNYDDEEEAVATGYSNWHLMIVRSIYHN